MDLVSIEGVIPKYVGLEIGLIDSDRVSLMIDQLGLEGYGAMMLLNEKLATTPTHKLHISFLPVLARKYNTSTAKLETVVNNYGLFVLENQHIFYSEEINEKIKIYARGVAQRKEAALISAKKRQISKPVNDGTSQRLLNGRSTNRSTDAQQLNKTKLNISLKDIYLISLDELRDRFENEAIGEFFINKITNDEEIIEILISMRNDTSEIVHRIQIKKLRVLQEFFKQFVETEIIPTSESLTKQKPT